ncbi:pyrroloquinoline quinone-dependent dehydrogenase [Deinococcus ruber]|uniref:Alcohol dehydrogenase n=1 Tax=Deinococcus ruber TaxID=1848197 RepID=A0A918F497_9DEIO|nr:PQQ-binding-like beta-propeller repeat protein [Deinococcus ruber]GGR07311.1 alcohol dehydrogenase [Deinococcus ruber]
MKKAHLLMLALTASLLGTAGAVQGPTQDDLNNADQATDSWLMYNKGYMGQRYSPLDQINASNAANLQKTCTFKTGEAGSFQVTPQVYKGSMFIATSEHSYAIDASNCKLLWTNVYKPTGPEVNPVSRGFALADGVAYRGTPDAHLIAIDMGTGKTLWDVKVADSSNGYFTSSAPVVWNGMVFTGEAGADWGVKAHMYAFDAKTGKKMWTFDLIPTGNQAGADTWQNADSTATGGGSIWSSYTIDANKGLIYMSVGNPAPDFAAEYRPGANLYTNSVVALDAKTGKLDHYYQQTPNDSKDYDTSAAPVLYDVDGATRMAVSTKGGYLFSYDETTQKQVFKKAVITVKNQDKRPTKAGLPICPNYTGGSQWSSPAYMPSNKMLVVNAVDWCGVVKLGEVRLIKGQLFFGGAMQLNDIKTAVGNTIGYDAATGKELWRYSLPGVRIVGGVTTTGGGLVMSGDSNGTMFVLDGTSGKVLYKDNVGKAPIGGGVATYTVGGKQYMALAAGNTSKGVTGVADVGSRIVIYSLK